MRPVIESVALGSARPAEVGVREVSGRRFAMVALRWTGEAPAGVQVQAQRRDNGSWTAWLDVEAQDGPDGGTTPGSEPLWVGDSTAIRVRAAQNDGLSVVLIDPGTSTTDARLTADAGPTDAVSATSVAQPAVISRAGWGADETIRTDCFARQGIGVDYASTVKAATIHHTAGTNDYTAADSARIVRGIYAYHAVTNDWCDIGYNVLVDKYGQIFEGRYGGLYRPVWGAHAGGFNQYTFGVSMLGTFTDVAPTAALIDSVSQIVAWKLAGSYRDPNGQVTLISAGGGTSKYPAGTPVTLPTIFGHRDTGATECPGNLGYQQLPTIRQRATALMGDWRSSPIYTKWQTNGADAGPLGGVFELEQDAAAGGRWASFSNPNITVYWSPTYGAHIVLGAIQTTWDRYGRERGLLSYPLTDELATPDGVGRYNHFASNNGSIYWSPNTGAHEVHGAIKSKWAALGWEWSVLGYPITDETATPDGVGRYNHF
ncbi:MAG TPA: N-acetylmuramoyl-L-alanine amidase, partial [Pseudonocardiaceae bacterium]